MDSDDLEAKVVSEEYHRDVHEKFDTEGISVLSKRDFESSKTTRF